MAVPTLSVGSETAEGADENGPEGKKPKGSQTELELDPGAKGRFEKSEPTIVDGEDLDVPAFLRKGD